MHVQEMYRRLTGLVVFRRLLQDPVVAACGEMLSARVRGDSGDLCLPGRVVIAGILQA